MRIHAETKHISQHIPDDTDQYEIVLLPGGRVYAWKCRICDRSGTHDVNPDHRGIFRSGFTERNVRWLFPASND